MMKTVGKFFVGMIFVLLFVSGWVLLTTQPSTAAGSWYVSPVGDDGNTCLDMNFPCKSINGVLAQPGFIMGDTILIATGTYTGTGNQVVLLNQDAILSGGWDESFTIQNGVSMIDGEHTRRGMVVSSSISAIGSHLAIQNGVGLWGGGIYNQGTLSLTDSTISKNNGSEGGGIFNWGTMTVTHSIIRNNIADVNAGIQNKGTLTFEWGIVRDNITEEGCGGINNVGGTVHVTNSSIIDNTGSGIRNEGGMLVVNNSTIGGNTSVTGGGIDNDYSGTVFVNNSTITGNEGSPFGGGIRNGSGTFTLMNSIVAGNTGEFPDCFDEITSAGYNLIGDTTGCNFAASTGDQVNVAAELSSMVGMPGATLYFPLMPDSPAVNAGNPGGCFDHLGEPLPADQRGVSRVSVCDIGAYEYITPGTAEHVVAVGGMNQIAGPNMDFLKPLTVAVVDNLGSPVEGSLKVTFTAPVSGPSGVFQDTGTYTTTDYTDDQGISEITDFSANTSLGNFTVTATSGNLTPAVFPMTNAAWFVKTDGVDSNDCLSALTPCATINGALTKTGVFPGDSIMVATGVYTGTSDRVVYLNQDAIISGGWNAEFANRDGFSVVDGEGARKGITVPTGTQAILEYFLIQNGSEGITNYGDLDLNNITVVNSLGTGITNNYKATLTLNNSTVSNSSANGIHNNGYVELINSQVNDNQRGIYNESGGKQILLKNSTVNGNTLTSNNGAGIYNGSNSNMMLVNCTVSGNISNSGSGGGIYNDRGTVTTKNCTISNNQSPIVGGVRNYDGTVNLQNTILAGNIDTNDSEAPDCFGNITSQGYNLVGDTSGCVISENDGDLMDIYPGLFPLIGSPGYHPLLPNSPAVDAGNPSGCTDHLGVLLPFDQRGVERVGPCDIGSYEYDPDNYSITQVFIPCIFKNYCSNFFDDFSDPNSGWYVGDDSFLLVEYLSGEYRVRSKVDGYFYSIGSPSCSRENYTVEVDARWVGTPGLFYGIIFGITGSYDAYYVFGVNTDYQVYRLDRLSSGGWTEIIPWSASSSINAGTASNHLGVTRNGDQITMEVNSTSLGSVTDGIITGLTYAGVSINPYDGVPVADARFDNFSMVNLVGGGGSKPNQAETTRIPNRSSRPYLIVPSDMDW